MQLPYRPGQDSAGKLMQADYAIDDAIDSATPKNNSGDSSSILKRMLDYFPLPEVMLV